ncbi:hypothetical protein JTB14_030304 [Gonioctena quinquepunctata]|nr:hypothetical protein JTB14_030304 [Gonioctena quinquepunctata]
MQKSSSCCRIHHDAIHIDGQHQHSGTGILENCVHQSPTPAGSPMKPPVPDHYEELIRPFGTQEDELSIDNGWSRAEGEKPRPGFDEDGSDSGSCDRPSDRGFQVPRDGGCKTLLSGETTRTRDDQRQSPTEFMEAHLDSTGEDKPKTQ